MPQACGVAVSPVGVAGIPTAVIETVSVTPPSQRMVYCSVPLPTTTDSPVAFWFGIGVALPQPLPHFVQLVGPLALVQLRVKVVPVVRESGPLPPFARRSIVCGGGAEQETEAARQAEYELPSYALTWKFLVPVVVQVYEDD